MKRLISSTLALQLVGMYLNAQNCPSYDINGGFETVSSAPDCSSPTGSHSVTKAVGWNSILSADVFNSSMTSCLGASVVRSNNYAAGFFTSASNKEYIYRNIGALIPGSTYTVQAYFKGSGGLILPGSNVGIWMIQNYVSGTPSGSQLANPTWTSAGNGWYSYKASFVASTGNYTLFLGSIPNHNVYVCVDDVTLKLAPPPTVSVTSDDPKCYPNCINMSANVSGGSSPYTYTWSNGYTTQSQVLCTPGSLTYAVTVKDVAGCTATASKQVTVASPVPVNAGPDVTICGIPNATTNYAQIGSTYGGHASSYTFFWSPTSGLSSPTSPNPKAYPASTTIYTVQMSYTYPNGLICSKTDQVKVSVVPALSCQSEKYAAQSTIENIGNISVPYPNPSNGNMEMQYSLAEEQTGEFLIFDVTGKFIASYSMLEGENTLKISEGSLQNGIYVYKIIINGELLKTDKISIIK